ncbi:MAG TPA: COX15/CtaA family protein [Acidimicrobiales bacterium]|nr:COX15/CtaA family protein [Acidimicrobiales bacterium]
MAAPPTAEKRRPVTAGATAPSGAGRWLAGRTWTASPRAFQVVALVAVWALALTIISGAAVRLTGSGLGCSTWPSCTQTSVVAPWRLHAWIEFGNRLINAAVTVAAVGALVVALRRRPRRRDLTWLSVGMVAGLLVEVVMGGLVVYSDLNPVLVSIHFLFGLAFLALAVVLHHRSGLPDGPPAGVMPAGEPQARVAPAGVMPAGGPQARVALVRPWQIRLSRLMLVALTVVVALGTVVTSTGPHGGDPRAPRFHFSLHSVAQLHGTSVEAFLALTLVMLWSLAHTGAPRPVIRRAQVMLVVLAAQAAVGYAQYLSGDPVAIVAVHVAGASLAVIAVLRFYFGLWTYGADPSTAAGGDPYGLARPAPGPAAPAAG